MKPLPLASVCALASLVSALPASAAAPGLRASPDAPPRATSLRIVGAVAPFDQGAIGLQIHHQLGPAMGVDGSVSWASVNRQNGVRAELLARGGYYGLHHALTVGIGPSLLVAEKFGPVAFFEAELAYEYRLRGFSVLVGAGPSVALTNSDPDGCGPNARVAPREGHGDVDLSGLFRCGLLETRSFTGGDIFPRMRVAIGRAF